MAIDLLENDDGQTKLSLKQVMRRYSDLMMSGKYKAEAYINSTSSIITMSEACSVSTYEHRLINAISNAEKELKFIEDVNCAISKLDSLQQQALIFRFVFGYSYADCDRKMKGFRRTNSQAMKNLAILLEITVYK